MCMWLLYACVLYCSCCMYYVRLCVCYACQFKTARMNEFLGTRVYVIIVGLSICTWTLVLLYVLCVLRACVVRHRHSVHTRPSSITAHTERADRYHAYTRTERAHGRVLLLLLWQVFWLARSHSLPADFRVRFRAPVSSCWACVLCMHVFVNVCLCVYCRMHVC